MMKNKNYLTNKHLLIQIERNFTNLKEVILKHLLIGALLVVFLAPGAFANGAGAGVAGSPHDFSDNVVNPWNTREEICRTCHVPHDHQRALYPEGLLWNHEVTNQTFTTYTFMDGTSTDQPDGISKLCLGCHDGTVGIDEWDGKNQGAGTEFIGGGDLVPGAGNAGSLARTHPLSVTYNYDAADADGLLDPATTAMGTSGMVHEVLENGKVQCSSCHDVHDNESVAGTHLLRVETKASQGTASGLCLTCHNK